MYNDPQLIRGCVQLHKEFVEALKGRLGPDQFSTVLFLQPIPTYLSAISQQQGGNMLGLDRPQRNAVLWTSGVFIDGDEVAMAFAQAELDIMTAKVKKLTKSLQADFDLIYLNYADPSQDPLGSYGAANIQYMRGVASRYDPTGVFQQRVPGGFKISRVQ